jgi:hypothetical protein
MELARIVDGKDTGQLPAGVISLICIALRHLYSIQPGSLFIPVDH